MIEVTEENNKLSIGKYDYEIDPGIYTEKHLQWEVDKMAFQTHMNMFPVLIVEVNDK